MDILLEIERLLGLFGNSVAVVVVLLLPERLGVEGSGRGGSEKNAGEDRQGSRVDTVVFMTVLLEVERLLWLFGGSVAAVLVLLVPECSGVEGGGRGGRDAGEDRQSEQGGYDDFHGCSPRG
jgi:hypothetical protein